MIEIYRSPVCYIEGYRAYTVHYDSGKKTTVLEHREIMEKHVGRKLLTSEHVHHKDENKLNNSLENLVILTSAEHALLHHAPEEPVELTCIFCNCKFYRKASRERCERKRGKFGPFCTNSCSGKYFSGSSKLAELNKLGKSFSGRKSKDGVHASEKLTPEVLLDIRTKIANGRSIRSIARELSVDHSTISYRLKKNQID